MLDYILLVLLICLYFVFRWKHRKFYELSKTLGKNSASLPVIGMTHLFAGDGEVIMSGIETVGRQVLEKNGLLAEWLGHRFFVAIGDPLLADYLSKTCLERHDIVVNCLGLVIGQASIAAPVNVWRGRRRMIAPTFSFKNIREYLHIFAEQSQVFVEQVRPLLDSRVLTLQYYIKYTMETLCQTTLGVRLDIQRVASQHPFITALAEVTDLAGDRFAKPWLHSDFIYKLLPRYKICKKFKQHSNNILDEIIYSLKQNTETKGFDVNRTPKSKSLVQLLVESLEDDKEFSHEEVREEAVGVLMAGTETTGVSAGFISHVLALHPDVQDQVFQELTDVIGKQECLSSEILSQLHYLDAVIKEVLRLYPPVPIIGRQVEEDCVLPSGLILPRGCGVILHLWAVNRNPQYWGADAEEFRPERFLDPRHQHADNFATFGFGPRNCIGKTYAMTSLKTLFATILRHYRFEPCAGAGGGSSGAGAGAGRGGDELRLTYAITMKDVNNFRVQIKNRDT